MNLNFTDIHCHIIPDVDDGSPDMESSLLLVEQSHDEGIRRMIATPHFGIINPMYDPERVQRNFDALCNQTAKLYPDMQLYLGNEIFLAPGLPDGLDDGLSNTLAGSRYVLVEFPMDIDYEFIYQSMRRLMMSGYIPVFAHAERYLYSLETLDSIYELVNMDVKIQVNSNSLSNNVDAYGFLERRFGEKAEAYKKAKFAEAMLQEGFIHFISTDCHYMPGRYPMMLKAVDRVIELVGEDAAEQIFIENPKQIFV